MCAYESDQTRLPRIDNGLTGLYLTSTRVTMPAKPAPEGRFQQVRRSLLLRRVTKIAAAGIATAALALTATACGSSRPTESAGTTGGKGVGLAYDVGGRGDHSFNDSAARGIDKAEKELERQGQGADRQATARPRPTASSASPRWPRPATTRSSASASPTARRIDKVAKKFPKTTFGLVDSVVGRQERRQHRLHRGARAPTSPASPPR